MLVFTNAALIKYSLRHLPLQNPTTGTSKCRRKNVGVPELSQEKFSVSLQKDFIFSFHIYFSDSFAFYFLVSDTSQTSAMVSFNIETLHSGANLLL